MIFDSVVTIFFRLQRKLEEIISCSEVKLLLCLETRALWITYLDHLIPETKREKKGRKH